MDKRRAWFFDNADNSSYGTSCSFVLLKTGSHPNYFSFVFEFIHLDGDGNPVERKLEELDALKKDRWENLETTEFQMSTIPWVKILKLSADIGAIVLKDIPVVGTTMKVASAVASQGPDIVEEMRK